RIARAWEVWRGTGRGLAAWQREPTAPAPGWRFAGIVLDPPRADLRAAIAVRFHQMLAQGAVEEVRALLALNLDPALPAMRAHGVPEIAASLRGEITIEEAAQLAILATGQYTKRQATWMRGRPLTEAPAHTIHARFANQTQFSESILTGIEEFLRNPG
ncbi:MAG: tRNA dimethylallyltransferase, partial [Acetobacteraceae bacterium]